MRLLAGMLGAALALGACSLGRALPPEQNSLAKRLQPRPQRALVYLHGDAQRSRGAGTLLIVSANAPGSPPMALGLPPGPGTAKLKVFNDTFSLVDAPEGVLTVVLAAGEGAGSDPARAASDALSLPIAPGRKYYVRVREPAPVDAATRPAGSPFVVESGPEGELAIAPALLGGFVRLNDPALRPPPPTAQHTP